MKAQAVNIDGKEYGLSYNLRAMILFEIISGKPFELNGLSDWAMFVYSCFLSANQESDITFDAFIDSLEEPELQKAIKWLTEALKVNNQLSDDKTTSKKK